MIPILNCTILSPSNKNFLIGLALQLFKFANLKIQYVAQFNNCYAFGRFKFEIEKMVIFSTENINISFWTFLIQYYYYIFKWLSLKLTDAVNLQNFAY